MSYSASDSLRACGTRGADIRPNFDLGTEAEGLSKTARSITTLRKIIFFGNFDCGRAIEPGGFYDGSLGRRRSAHYGDPTKRLGLRLGALFSVP